MTRAKAASSLNSGSPATGEPEYLVVGYLRRTHGLQGEILMDIATDFPERLQRDTRVYIGAGHEPAVIERVRAVSRGVLIKFLGTESAEAAARLCKEAVFVTSRDRPELESGQYYHHQLLGIAVFDEAERPLGALTEILQTGANDVYVVQQPSGQELLLPALASVIVSVDLKRRVMHVKVPEVLGQDGPR